MIDWSKKIMYVIWLKRERGFFNGLIDYKDNFIGLSKDLLEARALNEKEVKILSLELDKMGKLYSVLQIVK